MSEEKKLTEQESLQLIADMIQKAKGGFHERGTSAILWGSAVGTAGLVSFAERYWNFYIGFDIWWLVLAAIIPQVFISIRESKNRKVVSHTEAFMNAVWSVFGISIFALIFYLNIIRITSEQMIAASGNEWLVKNINTGQLQHLHPFVLSESSLFLIIYAIPTVIIGIASKCKPMLYGGILCYVFFVISCYTSQTYDFLLTAFAGIFNWLIPGLILRNKYLKGKNC